jgi:hypothetical protein
MASPASTKSIRLTDGMRITYPAAVTLFGYVLLALILLAPFDMYGWDEMENKSVPYEYNLGQRLLLLLLLLFPLILGVYSVNCFVVGQCHVLSWVVAIFTLVWACAVVFVAFVTKTFHISNVFV